MLKVTQIEFEVEKGINRNACICCESDEDAINFIKTLYKGKPIRINNIGFDKTIHGFSDTAVEYLQKRLKLTKIDENAMEREETTVYKCPWCDKEFPKSASLKVHMNKAHDVKVVE